VESSPVLVVANIPALELDRMTDDGGPAGHLNGTPPGASSHTGTSMGESFRQLGASHRRRNELASLAEYARQDRDLQRHTALRRHWPGIVAALRTLACCYNEGVGFEALAMADHANADSRTRFVEIAARGGQTLTITLVGAELCVCQNPGPAGSLDGGRRWIAPGASDETTAAYALQHWLTQL
jgi:hypothetical protein